MALFVGKLDPAISADEVKELFKKHGQLQRITYTLLPAIAASVHEWRLSVSLSLFRTCQVP